jgi:hypothetical protein
MIGNSSASQFELLISFTPPTSIISLIASVFAVAWFGLEIVSLATRASANVMSLLLGFGIAFLFLPLLNCLTSSSKLATLELNEVIFDFCALNPFDIIEYRLLVEGLLFFLRSLI